MNPDVSIVILTYRRRESVLALLENLEAVTDPAVEIIVVDNGSDDGTAEAVAAAHPHARLVRQSENTGVGARNRGMETARGAILVTLDDDMLDLDDRDIALLRLRFAETPDLAGLCFKVTWPGSDRVRDWVHRPPPSTADRCFDTYEITEGAVAYRAAALAQVGMYREDLFISHEGLDLSYRLWDAGWRIEYDGRIAVGHAHAVGGRKSWRRYYFDTRNLLWISLLHQPLRYAVPYLARGLAAMAVYSIRDGFLLTWLRAVRDGLLGLPEILRERRVWSPSTHRAVLAMDAKRPPFLELARRRLRQKDFSLE